MTQSCVVLSDAVVTEQSKEKNMQQSLTDKIEEVLSHKWGFRQGSSITNAVAYIIFGFHSQMLVNYSDKPYLAGNVTFDIVRQAVEYNKSQLDSFMQNAIEAKTRLATSNAA